jgi:sugar phosphate isomerase/epimerase
MSETPRTDAARFRLVWKGGAYKVSKSGIDDIEIVGANVAEDLERELAAVTRERDEFQRLAGANGLAGLALGRDLGALRAEVERLRKALDFYACVDHYKRLLSCAPNVVQDDGGKKARAAITPAEDAVLDAAKRRSHTIVATPVAVKPAEEPQSCRLGCVVECLARSHGCASECPALPWQPKPAEEPKT